MYGSISGGGAGDARDDETVNEGVVVTITWFSKSYFYKTSLVIISD